MTMRLAARVSGLRKGKSKVVLVLSGDSRAPFEGERIRRTVRRAVRIAQALDSSLPDVWIYGADCHRLPAIQRGSPETWIADWAVLAKRPVFDESPGNDNPLACSVREYGLFKGGSVAGAMEVLQKEYGTSRRPVLVLFHVESMEVEDRRVARQLEKASGKPLFWQFLAQLDEMSFSVLDRLDDVRRERPRITNAHYNNSWNMDISVGLDVFQQYAMIKPYARWVRESHRQAPG
ncbi:VWA domain-containing protein [Streptomyces sp. NPDC058001]|uniref:VWA domain-containing protein n=1 Tax=Streptomyces sp. NPDC058001 TaxID=3346300 RepID=UPI0036E4F293